MTPQTKALLDALPSLLKLNGNIASSKRLFADFTEQYGGQCRLYRSRKDGYNHGHMINALRILRKEGKVKPYANGVWKWIGGES